MNQVMSKHRQNFVKTFEDFLLEASSTPLEIATKLLNMNVGRGASEGEQETAFKKAKKIIKENGFVRADFKSLTDIVLDEIFGKEPKSKSSSSSSSSSSSTKSDSTNPTIKEAISSLDRRFNNKVSALENTKNDRISLINKVSSYLLGLDKFDTNIQFSKIGDLLVFNVVDEWNDFLTKNEFDNIMKICLSINSMMFNFIDFRSNKKIETIELEECNAVNFLKYKIKSVAIDYNF